MKMLRLRYVTKNVEIVAKHIINLKLLVEIVNHPGVLYTLHEEFETMRE